MLYSMYRGSGEQYLSDACKAMLGGAEQDCAWLVERKTKGGPSWEFGPGMEMAEEETEAADGTVGAEGTAEAATGNVEAAVPTVADAG